MGIEPTTLVIELEFNEEIIFCFVQVSSEIILHITLCPKAARVREDTEYDQRIPNSYCVF